MNEITPEQRLEDTLKKLDALRLSYEAPKTHDAETDEKGQFSEDYEFDDAFSDPQKALGLIIEAHQLGFEITTGKRMKIVNEDKAAEIINRNKAHGDKQVRELTGHVKPSLVKIPDNRVRPTSDTVVFVKLNASEVR